MGHNHKARPQALHEVANPVAMHPGTPLNIEEWIKPDGWLKFKEWTYSYSQVT